VLQQNALPDTATLDQNYERPIAIFLPLWKEHDVIEQMLAHNLVAVKYNRYQVFVGAYPNDEPTLQVLRRLEPLYPRLRVCMVPHDGPTSKADCLNWVWQNMILYESERGIRFETIVVHDAEDILHPDEFRILNHFTLTHDFVQLPVLALPTPLHEFTHGVYCDEFAESHSKDLPLRVRLGGFLPSAGVGTAYNRNALETLASEEDNRLFEPRSLTEDYINGMHLHRHGAKQIMLPMTIKDGLPVAVREYFPRQVRAAWRQRSRWVTGISLQGWEQEGWGKSWREKYWFWRDRKGIVGNPLTLLANILTLLLMVEYVFARNQGRESMVEVIFRPAGIQMLCLSGIGLQIQRLCMRTLCSGPLYGWPFALLAPFRVFWGNYINCRATLMALRRYAIAKWKKQPLVWIKTEHCYPTMATLETQRMVASDLLTLDTAISASSREASLEDLVRLLQEDPLFAAEAALKSKARQYGLTSGDLRAHEISRVVARRLPPELISELRVLPVQVRAGEMIFATDRPPSDKQKDELLRFCSLPTKFHLVSSENFAHLQTELIRSGKNR
jgi:bacteriophage N4 adsorption protein B